MYTRRFLTHALLAAVAGALFWGIDPGYAQTQPTVQAPTTNASGRVAKQQEEGDTGGAESRCRAFQSGS